MSWRDELVRRFPALATLPPSSYVVGGAIRDLLMGREPADADVACLDPLSAARTVSPKVIRLGDQEHLSAYRVVLPEHVYDFAELLDGNIADDLARRDFTVNAMAVDLSNGALLDPHGGQQDLRDGIVRMVHAGNFDDDPLRTLKGVRMAVKYGMSIDEATIAAIRERAPKLASVAKERVMYELSVIFSSNAFRSALDLLHRTALDGPLGLVGAAALSGTATAEGSGRHIADDVSFAGALALAGGEHWGWSHALLREVATLQRLIDHHDRIALYDAGESIARQLPAILRALGRDDALDFPDFSIRPLLTGEEIGITPGPELGRVKRALLEAQIRGEVTTRAQARDWLSSRA
jgi:tRNA nucleotidyltransferase/poly(A) polymerase